MDFHRGENEPPVDIKYSLTRPMLSQALPRYRIPLNHLNSNTKREVVQKSRDIVWFEHMLSDVGSSFSGLFRPTNAGQHPLSLSATDAMPAFLQAIELRIRTPLPHFATTFL